MLGSQESKNGQVKHLGIECGPARLNRFDLGGRQGLAVEACRKVVAVEKGPLGGRNRTKVGAGTATDATVRLDGLAKRAELLGMVTVCAERRVGRGGK